MHDYSEFQDDTPAIGDNAMARLGGVAVDQKRAEATVARLERELKEAKESERHISENVLPQLMEDMGLTKFTTSDGLEIKIDERVRGSIPKANQVEAFAWLDDHGHANIIKRQFVIDFGKDEERWAAKFQRDLNQRKRPLATKVTRTVHAQTLQAFIKGQLGEGVPIPMDVFGVYRQRFSKVTVPTNN